jgi:hypothetical protein
MSRIQKAIIGIAVAGAVGITYMLTTLKGLPEAFDWNLEEDEDEDY